MLSRIKIITLGLLLLLGVMTQSCDVLSLPAVAGTWDLTFFVDNSNCPDVISPPMSKQVWVVTQNEEKVTILIKTVDGKDVNFEFAVNATLQQDGNFSFNQTFYQTYKSYYLRMNIICNANINGNQVSGDIQLSLQDMDTYESCVEQGRVEGTKRTES